MARSPITIRRSAVHGDDRRSRAEAVRSRPIPRRLDVMPTIDSQVHAYERDHPGRPGASVLRGPPQVTGDEMVAAMEAVGVDGALLVSPFAMYRYDGSYALEVYA